ncbi:hypothetical protein BVI434_3090004 [Burkholderia vietnamiensis]|nr:hypothetical protein BVI434_3090004 [Burkholderia vietnamiensis]
MTNATAGTATYHAIAPRAYSHAIASIAATDTAITVAPTRLCWSSSGKRARSASLAALTSRRTYATLSASSRKTGGAGWLIDRNPCGTSEAQCRSRQDRPHEPRARGPPVPIAVSFRAIACGAPAIAAGSTPPALEARRGVITGRRRYNPPKPPGSPPHGPIRPGCRAPAAQGDGVLRVCAVHADAGGGARHRRRSHPRRLGRRA